MCIIVAIHSFVCECITLRRLTCREHIFHTRLQKDTNDCPNIELRHVEIADKEAGCKAHGSSARCTHKLEQHLYFAPWIHDHEDRNFLEIGSELWLNHTMGMQDCLNGDWLPPSLHMCGLGAAIQHDWRHLDYEGNILGVQAVRSVAQDDDTTFGVEGLTLTGPSVNHAFRSVEQDNDTTFGVEGLTLTGPSVNLEESNSTTEQSANESTKSTNETAAATYEVGSVADGSEAEECRSENSSDTEIS